LVPLLREKLFQRQRCLESLSWYFISWSVREVPLLWARFTTILYIVLGFELRSLRCVFFSQLSAIEIAALVSRGQYRKRLSFG